MVKLALRCRPMACAALAVLLPVCFHAARAADSPPAVDDALAGRPLFQTEFTLRIDGGYVVGASAPSAPEAPAPEWRGDFSSHDLLGVKPRAPGGVHLLNRAGEDFVVRARRGEESWEIAGSAAPLAGAAIEMRFVVTHNGGVILDQREVVGDGEPAVFQLGKRDRLREVPTSIASLQLAYTVRRVDAAALPSDRTRGAGRAAMSVDAAADSKSAAADEERSKPSEIAASRRMRPPRYPPSAVRAGVQGKVMVNVLVGADGVPSSADVFGIEPASAVELGGAAVAAALQWRYRPALHDGQPVGAALLVPVDFRLRPGAGERIPEPDPARPLPLGYRKVTLPRYPLEAVQNRIAGKVFVRAEIAADGSVSAARVEQVLPESAADLGEAALQAVKRWQFAPTVTGGRARPDVVRIPFEFRLAPDAGPATTLVGAPLEPVANLLETVVVEPPSAP